MRGTRHCQPDYRALSGISCRLSRDRFPERQAGKPAGPLSSCRRALLVPTAGTVRVGRSCNLPWLDWCGRKTPASADSPRSPCGRRNRPPAAILPLTVTCTGPVACASQTTVTIVFSPAFAGHSIRKSPNPAHIPRDRPIICPPGHLAGIIPSRVSGAPAPTSRRGRGPQRRNDALGTPSPGPTAADPGAPVLPPSPVRWLATRPRTCVVEAVCFLLTTVRDCLT
jgi:hypothetical protein